MQFHLYEILKAVKIINIESERMIVRAWERDFSSYFFNGCSFSSIRNIIEKGMVVVIVWYYEHV